MKSKQEPTFMAFDEVIIMQMTRFVPNGASVIIQPWNKRHLHLRTSLWSIQQLRMVDYTHTLTYVITHQAELLSAQYKLIVSENTICKSPLSDDWWSVTDLRCSQPTQHSMSQDHNNEPYTINIKTTTFLCRLDNHLWLSKIWSGIKSFESTSTHYPTVERCRSSMCTNSRARTQVY